MANITVSDLYINSKKMPTPALEGGGHFFAIDV